MLWKLLTDTVVVLHGAWVVGVVVLPAWAWRNARVRAVHLGMLWWTFLVLSTGLYCPVSEMENSFRVHYDPSRTYSGSFVVHYVNEMTGWDLTQPRVIAAMSAWAFGWTVLYVFLWVRARRKPAPAGR